MSKSATSTQSINSKPRWLTDTRHKDQQSRQKLPQYPLVYDQSSYHTLPRGEIEIRDNTLSTADSSKSGVRATTSHNKLKLPQECVQTIRKQTSKRIEVDKLQWLCHELRATGGLTAAGAPLNSAFYSSRLGVKGARLQSRLVELGLIEKCASHSSGNRCARFRFTASIRNNPHLVSAKMQTLRLIKNRSSYLHLTKAKLAGARLPIKLLSDLGDISASIEFFVEFERYIHAMEKAQKNTTSMRALYEIWRTKKINLSVKDCRLTSHICLTPGELRQYLTVYNKPAVELDFPSSHPAILASIFRPTEKSHDLEIQQHGKLINLIQQGHFYTAFEHCWHGDRWTFVKFAVSKKTAIYASDNHHGYLSRKADFLALPPRKGIKLCWQIILNTRPHFHETSMMKELAESCPSLVKRLNKLKDSGNDTLGHILRINEARMIADLASKTSQPCATIYDGLLTNSDGATEIESFTAEVTKKHLGFEHRLSIKKTKDRAKGARARTGAELSVESWNHSKHRDSKRLNTWKDTSRPEKTSPKTEHRLPLSKRGPPTFQIMGVAKRGLYSAF